MHVRELRAQLDGGRAINTARGGARQRVGTGQQSPLQGLSAGQPLIFNLDGTHLTTYSEKYNARPMRKQDFGFHPSAAYVDLLRRRRDGALNPREGLDADRQQ